MMGTTSIWELAGRHGRKKLGKVGIPPPGGGQYFLLAKESNESRASRSNSAPKKGYMAVYVGEEMRWYVIPTTYICMPEFTPVMETVREEFGYEQSGGLSIPCDVDEFEKFIQMMEESRSKRK